VEPGEVDRLVAAFEAVEAHGNVNARHVGYVGLSAGGSLVAIAAARPAIAERVRFVLAIGPYYDAETLAADVVSETMQTPEGIEPWHPRSIARYVVRETLLSTLPDGERAAIEGERTPEGEQARAVAELLSGTSRERAEELLAGLEGTEAHLQAVSPRYALGGLRAPLYLVHDVADEFIPWVESERLAEAHRPAVYHRTEIFEHVEPRIDSMGVVVRDGWRLFRLFTRVIRDSGLPR
jgi:acetyl esterase/lipase